MMRKSDWKKAGIFFWTVFLITVILPGCSGGNSGEFEQTRKFEMYFYPEEYEEQYSHIEKTIELDKDTDYQFYIQAVCSEGSLELTPAYSGAEDEAYRASSGLPCRETLSLTADTADTITFLIDIFPDTEGSVVVEILERD